MLKGVSKVVVNKETNHDDYVNVIATTNALTTNVTIIKSFNHQLYSFKPNKLDLTSFYVKMQHDR